MVYFPNPMIFIQPLAWSGMLRHIPPQPAGLELDPGPAGDVLQLSPIRLTPPVQLFAAPEAPLHHEDPGVNPKIAAAAAAVPGRSWIGKLPANGNREVAILVPQGVDTSQPVELIYYFHGLSGRVENALSKPSTGLKDEMLKMAASRNAVFVIPQGPPESRHYTWFDKSTKEDMAAFQQQTQDILQTRLAPGIPIGSITVKGHSAGGHTIMNAALAGKLQADRIDMFDASYGHWATRLYQGFVAKNPQVQMNVIYIPGTSTAPDALRLQGKPQVRLMKAAVSHGAVPRQFLAQ